MHREMSEPIRSVQAGDNGGGLDQGGGGGEEKRAPLGDVSERKINRAWIRGSEGEFKDR